MKEIYVPPHLHIYMCNLDIYICEGAKEGERERSYPFILHLPPPLYFLYIKRKEGAASLGGRKSQRKINELR